MEIIWKNISPNPSYGYEVSNQGLVRSLEKYVEYKDGRVRKYTSKLIACRLDPKGYFSVCLYSSVGIYKDIRVHRLVAEAFISNPDNKPYINHKDGNRRNNNVNNLEWCTASENTLDGIKRGSINKPSKKLSEKDIIEIRNIYENLPYRQYQIAEMYGVGQAQISRIINKKNWI